MKLVHSFLLLCTAITLTAQSNDTQNSIVKNIPFENIGPKVMSGRIVTLEVNPADPTEFYAAYASGGIWHTKDNGISFTSITDNAPTQNIGEIAMHWPSKTLWVGTGENNASRSSYAGIGMLKTTDNGTSWEVKGLEDSHHIGKILINPNNPEEVVVGVTGHLYTPNAERGIYRSEDGGDSWEQVLFVNETSGIIDMSIVPNDFNIQYAAAWQKDRKAWNFSGNGSSSGIYKSTDAGKTWADDRDFNPFEVYRSAGVGMRIFLPMFGLLGLDYGWRLDDVSAQPNMARGQFHFSWSHTKLHRTFH